MACCQLEPVVVEQALSPLPVTPLIDDLRVGGTVDAVLQYSATSAPVAWMTTMSADVMPLFESPVGCTPMAYQLSVFAVRVKEMLPPLIAQAREPYTVPP